MIKEDWKTEFWGSACHGCKHMQSDQMANFKCTKLNTKIPTKEALGKIKNCMFKNKD